MTLNISLQQQLVLCLLLDLLLNTVQDGQVFKNLFFLLFLQRRVTRNVGSEEVS